MSSYSPRISDPCDSQKSYCNLVAGPRGLTGPTGYESGTTGPTGPMGGSGPTGRIGNASTDGATGTSGSVGIFGDSQLTGPHGPMSMYTITGPTGQIGELGDTGPFGPTGSANPAGLTGNTGPTGYLGFTGNSGITGSAGDTGLTGPIGPSGTSELNGPRGYIAPRGNTGITGPGPYGSGSITLGGPLNSLPTTLTTFSKPIDVYPTDSVWIQGLIPDRDTKLLRLPLVQSYFSDVSTEFRNYYLTVNNLEVSSPSVFYTLNYLWKSNDKIEMSLNANRLAYINASDGTWVTINGLEYNALKSNVSGTTIGMASDTVMSASTSRNFSGTGTSTAFMVTNQSNSNCPPIPANSFVYAVTYKYDRISNTGLRVYQNTTTGTSNFTQIAGNLPMTAGGTNQFAVLKNRLAFRNPTAAETLVSLYLPAFGSNLFFKAAATAPTTTTGKFLISPGTITTATNLSNTFTNGAFAIQTLSTTTKQW